MGGVLRPAATVGAGDRRGRGLGLEPGGGAAVGRRGRGDPGAREPPRDGRADGHDPGAFGSGPRGRGPRLWTPGVLGDQPGTGTDGLVRGGGSRGGGAARVPARGRGPDPRSGAPGLPAGGRVLVRRPGAAHGGRCPHADPGGDQPPHQAPPARARGRTRSPQGRGGEVPLREPPVLPERRDGRREGRDQLGRGGGGLVDRHGDGEERDDVRDPGRGGRAVVRGPGAPGRGRPVPSRVRTGGRRAGHRRQRGPRAGGAGGGGGGGVPRGGRLRGRADRRCRGAFDGGRQDLRGSVGAVLPPPPRLPRGADRGRRPPGRGTRDHAGHQHRDPARHGRHRPGGGRGRARPDDCFREALLALPA